MSNCGDVPGDVNVVSSATKWVHFVRLRLPKSAPRTCSTLGNASLLNTSRPVAPWLSRRRTSSLDLTLDSSWKKDGDACSRRERRRLGEGRVWGPLQLATTYQVERSLVVVLLHEAHFLLLLVEHLEALLLQDPEKEGGMGVCELLAGVCGGT
jgi:hypothetical protein